MHLSTPLVAWKSQQGTRGKENDDHHGWFAIERSDLRRTLYIAMVADGVTSTEGGAQASRIAVEAVRAALNERPDPRQTISEWLADAVLHANEEILFEAKRNPQWKGMSTTVVLAVLTGEKLYVLHLGDSRAYLIRENCLYQLTTDHTWAQEAFDAGTLTAEEAGRHPGRNQLQRYLGAQHNFNIARGIIAPGTEQMEEYLYVKPGDVVLLCTDGVYRKVAPELITHTIVERVGYPQDAADQLVAAAADSGEIDDITALVIELPLGRPKVGESTTTSANTTSANQDALASFTLQAEQVQNSGPTWFTMLLTGVVLILAVVTLYLLLFNG